MRYSYDVSYKKYQLTTNVNWKRIHAPELEIVEIWNLQCVTASTLLEMNLVNLCKNRKHRQWSIAEMDAVNTYPLIW